MIYMLKSIFCFFYVAFILLLLIHRLSSYIPIIYFQIFSKILQMFKYFSIYFYFWYLEICHVFSLIASITLHFFCFFIFWYLEIFKLHLFISSITSITYILKVFLLLKTFENAYYYFLLILYTFFPCNPLMCFVCDIRV